MGALDSVVFGKKKFSNILEEIYNNQKTKSKQIGGLISELKPLIKDIGDATLIVPLIKEYMDNNAEDDQENMNKVISLVLQNVTDLMPFKKIWRRIG